MKVLRCVVNSIVATLFFLSAIFWVYPLLVYSFVVSDDTNSGFLKELFTGKRWFFEYL